MQPNGKGSGKSLILGLSLALLACAPSGTRLVEAEGGKVLRHTEFKLWIDDGIRCVTTPCPTNAREWPGTTDALGRFTSPEIGPEETVTVFVEGFLPAPLEPTSRTVRLERTVEPVRLQQLQLRTRFELDGTTLEVRVTNPGPRALSIVRPRAERLARYGSWGGWHLLIKAGGNHYLPFPLPGPYLAAGETDVAQLESGESLAVRVAVAEWRQAVPGTPQSEGRTLRDETTRVTARLRWAGVPEHLRVDQPAPRIVASARR